MVHIVVVVDDHTYAIWHIKHPSAIERVIDRVIPFSAECHEIEIIGLGDIQSTIPKLPC